MQIDVKCSLKLSTTDSYNFMHTAYKLTSQGSSCRNNNRDLNPYYYPNVVTLYVAFKLCLLSSGGIQEVSKGL